MPPSLRRPEPSPRSRSALKSPMPPSGSGSRTMGLAFPRPLRSAFSTCSSAPTPVMKAPASAWPSSAKSSNAWGAKSASIQSPARAAAFGSSCRRPGRTNHSTHDLAKPEIRTSCCVLHMASRGLCERNTQHATRNNPYFGLRILCGFRQSPSTVNINLAYGQGHLPVELPKHCTTVIEPSHIPGLADERAAVLSALEQPIAVRPLLKWLKPSGRVCILFTDLTRATPNERLIPWLLDHLSVVPRENVTLINSLGTHRPNTGAELERMLTPPVVKNYRVLNHEPENPDALIAFGATRDGTPALLNRHFVEADTRIVTGFIEPHFFAGFSGGPKGIMPGVAGLGTVVSNHGAKNLNDPSSTFGITEGNPGWEEMRDIALRGAP